MANTTMIGSKHKKPGKNKLEQLNQKLKKQPDSYEINLQLGIFHFQKNDAARAITYLEKACDIKKDQAELLFILANAYKVINNIPKSEVCFKKALALEPDNFEFLYNYGSLLHSSHRLDEATKVFEEAIKLQPDSYELLNDIGVLCHLQKEYKGAIHFFQEAIRINPDYIVSAINVGHVYLAINDLLNVQKVVDQISVTHHQNPEIIELKRQLSIALDRNGDDFTDHQTDLSVSDLLFQISPLKIT